MRRRARRAIGFEQRIQRAEVTARRREALSRAIEIDHELDRGFETRPARPVAEVRRRVGVIEVGREPRPRGAVTELGDDRGAAGCEPVRDVRDHRGVFMRAQDLFDEMSASIADRSTRRRLDRLVKVDVLVIDEMGYLNLRPEQTSIFFKLME